MIIYKVTNFINNKCYIGQTVKTLEERKRTHTWGNQLIHKAFKKYGIDNFIWEVIDDTCTSYDNLLEMEYHYIKQYHSYCKEWGYNLTLGGEGSLGRECKQETRNKISKSNKGRIAWNKGLTKEIDSRIKKQSDTQKGYKHSKKTKQKQSEKAKIRSNTKEHKQIFQKLMWSDKTIKKRKKTILKNGSYKGKKNSRYRHDIKDNIIKEMHNKGMSYQSIANELNCSKAMIYNRFKKMRVKNEIRTT